MIDERFVSLDHQDSNYGLAYNLFIRYLFKQKKLPHKNIHPFIYHKLPKNQAIRAYKNELREISHKYDIILLSSGPDGHVASLFPNHETIKSPIDYFIITESSPKIPKKRMSASRKLLIRSKTGILLFFGEKKKKAYENFLDKNLTEFDCPAKIIKKIKDSYVLLDTDARN